MCDWKNPYFLAPGSILQQEYISNRVKNLIRNNDLSSFVELGSGAGRISKILLELGLDGAGYDLNKEACIANTKLNKCHIMRGAYEVFCEDFFAFTDNAKQVDIIISSHVIEHFPDELLDKYLSSCKKILNKNGFLISVVPAGMKYWGPEDDLAHYRRFEFEDFHKISEKYEYSITDLSGLTFPLCNILLGTSNKIVSKHKALDFSKSKDENTINSSAGGACLVKWKTVYPSWVRYFVNKYTMLPFYALQRIFRKSKRSTVIYCELVSPKEKEDRVSHQVLR